MRLTVVMELIMNLQKAIKAHIEYIKEVQGCAVNTARQRRYTLADMARVCGVYSTSELTNRDIELWVLDIRARGGVKNQTVRANISHLKSFIRWCEFRDITVGVDSSKLPKFKCSKPKRYFYNRETIRQAINNCTNPKRRLAIELLYDTMMRRAEVANLHVCDIDGRAIYYTGKGGRQCTSYMSEHVASALLAYIADNKISERVFKVTPDTIGRWVKEAFSDIGVSNCTAHTLRHSGATELEKNGAPLRLISKILNHSSVATTEIYVHHYDTVAAEMKDRYMTI